MAITRDVSLADIRSLDAAITKMTATERERLLNWLIGSFAWQNYTDSKIEVTDSQVHFWNSVQDFIAMHSKSKFGRIEESKDGL